MRGGVATVFLATEPLRGLRDVLASEQRTRLDFAHFVRHLADLRTPKHGSWLNVAGIERAVLERQCLRQRFGDRAVLGTAVAARAARRNAAGAAVDWRFTTADARTKLKRLHPAFDA